MLKGRLPLREIERAPVEVSFDSQEDWVQDLLLRSAPGYPATDLKAEDWQKKSEISGALKAEKLNPEIMLEGAFKARVPVLCGRCGERGFASRSADFRLFFKPLDRYDGGDDEFLDDADYQQLEGSELDLVEILSEQLMCAESMVECPEHNEDGSEHKCSENNILSRQGSEKERESPFSKLKELKGKL